MISPVTVISLLGTGLTYDLLLWMEASSEFEFGFEFEELDAEWDAVLELEEEKNSIGSSANSVVKNEAGFSSLIGKGGG